MKKAKTYKRECRENTIFQSSYWSKIKRKNGWKSFSVKSDLGTPIICLEKSFFKIFILVYIPGINSCSITHENTAIQSLAESIRAFIGPRCFLIRLDSFEPQTSNGSKLQFYKNPSGQEHLFKEFRKKNSLIRRDLEIQPKTTVQLNLTESLDKIRNRYRKRAVRSIKKASASEIRAKYYDSTNLTSNIFDGWYQLYRETAERDGFSLRSRQYLKSLITQSNSLTKSRLFISEINQNMIAGAIVVYNSFCAYYLYGATSRLAKEKGAMYFLQDYIIANLKTETACYDLYGIAAPDSVEHHLKSLNMFKTSFGGNIVERIGVIDIPQDPCIYKIFSSIEKLWFKKKRNS
ncbi:MAG: peptidoglycan bridge formation glycyltransferase FemA/FemB family protein [Spirochaetia bacterium]|nr:peptidoglycan bridge formation glycyltransferase FemA/FemB family protein [Spirochaetia bacterium]